MHVRDRVICTRPHRGIVTSRDPPPIPGPYDPNHDHTPCPDAGIWPIATKPASARYMIWAICPPLSKKISW